jgi:hypothetical protein
VHDDAAACVTWSCCPPTETVAVRALVIVLATTVKLTVALPLPLALPLLIVSQAMFELAVQAHPGCEVSVMLPDPPAAVKLVVEEVAE